MKVPEKAVDYFEQASLMQPAEPKWLMLIGSCYRRAGNFQLALQTYKDVLNKFPDNTECRVQFLFKLIKTVFEITVFSLINRSQVINKDMH